MKDAVIEAVMGRRSVRSFLPTPVDDKIVEAILQAASRAPSGTNIQPWLVHVATGQARERLSLAARDVAAADMRSPEYLYISKILKEPYLSRRRKIGFDLYEKYGVAREDLEGRKEAMLRNFDFFGAPVGLFITMERDHALGAWLDCGMFMQNIMTVARAYGLETCPQQSWCDFGAVVHRELRIPSAHILLSGMALGYANDEAPENSLCTDRSSAEEFTTWHR